MWARWVLQHLAKSDQSIVFTENLMCQNNVTMATEEQNCLPMEVSFKIHKLEKSFLLWYQGNFIIEALIGLHTLTTWGQISIIN